MVVSTLNRNWKSFALAIVGAEYVLRWLPRGTHQWDKFVTPDELAQSSGEQQARHHRADRRGLQPVRRPLEPLLRHGRELHGGGGGGVDSRLRSWANRSFIAVGRWALVDRALRARHGGRNLPAATNYPHMFSIATLWIPFTIIAALGQVARNAMQRQLTGPLGTWGATNIRFLFGFPFSILFFARGAGRDRRSCAVADGGVLAVAVARRAQPDRRHRADAARDERPLLRGDDGVSENRGDPDRDLRLCLSRRSSHGC